ncbi:outer membrane protein assembly factor BamE [Candidatus Pelagibacter sp.]|jgi:outer membrane protein assembly factor BamE (lipoprotein component of BamABCDE complex)|nr:outer membrane protein assembly factor BamE [Candidatus Pelagibacter sp.]
MKKLFIFFIISLFISACTLKKVEKHHGVHFLNKKQEKLTVNQSNKNDILELLGSPSTKSTFDNDLWIYIERKTDTAFLRKFGNEKIIVNNVLLLEINNMGLLAKKEFLDLTNMQELKFVEQTTENQYRKNTFVYDFLSSLRHKINDPLNKRRK